MALILRRSLLPSFTPSLQSKRFRGKINIRKPKPPHFERAKYIELSKPYFLSPYKGKLPTELCKGADAKIFDKYKEENPFQRIIANELYERITSSRLIAFFHMNPMDSYHRFKAFAMFKKQNMSFKNYGKRTLEMAVKETPYEPILDYYISRNMTVFSPEPKLKELLTISKKFPQLILLYAVYEGHLITKDEFQYYSMVPNIQTVQAQLVQTLQSFGSQIVNNLNCRQTTLVSQLEERMKQLDIKK